MNDEAASSTVRCKFCGQLVLVRRLPEHHEECRQREHPTQERFE